MKISTRTRYGLRALLDIAVRSAGAPVSLEEIARRQGLSLSFLEHMVEPLFLCGILRATRSMFGGVSLGREPRDIMLQDVVNHIEGREAARDCVQAPKICPRSAKCATRRLWSQLADAIHGVLDTQTLEDLMHDDDGGSEGSCAVAMVRPLAGEARILGRVRHPSGTDSGSSW
jgi:Rrf2 family protein